MTHTLLSRFIEHAIELSYANSEPCQCVQALAPTMMELISHAEGFLEPEHYRANPAHYSRNLIYSGEDTGLSLYALVWSPGQWTPVHDHGSWGGGGVVEGLLEERSYVCLFV